MEKVATENHPTCENYQLKWSSYNSYIHTCIMTALSDDTHADVALVTMDGHQIMAHRFVLAYASQYMNKLLRFQPKVTTALPIMVVLPAEISFKAMKILVKYMYSGEATVSKDILKQVLRGGDILKIKGLYRESLEEEQQEKQFKQNQAAQSPTVAAAQCQSPVIVTDQNVKIKEKQSTPKPLTTESKKPGNNTTILNDSQKPNDVVEVQIKEGLAFKSGQKILLPKSSSNEKHQHGVKQYAKPQKVLNFSMNNKFNIDKENSSPKRTQNVILNSKVALQKEKPHTITSAEAAAIENAKSNDVKQEKDNLSYLVIKEEPVGWGDDVEVDDDIDDNVEISDIRVKSEGSCDSQSNDNGNSMFSPLTCELCTETFTIPAEWVRHVQTHTDMLPAKRRRRDSPDDTDENATYPELQCELCDKSFQTPAEWVRHIQFTHTEFELSLSNRKNLPSRKIAPITVQQLNDASKLIHKRTHTGEQPFQCVICNKGFNVKSNLLRHLRTLHNTIVNSSEVEASLEDSNSN